MRWLEGLTDRTDMSFSKLRETVKDSKARHAAVHGGSKESDMTERMKNNDLILTLVTSAKTLSS